VFLSAHIVDAGVGKAITALRSRPDPTRIDGLRYAGTWLTASLRTGIFPSLAVTGAIMIAAWDDDESLDRFLRHPLAKPYEPGWRVRLEPARSIGALPGLPDLPRQERPTGDHPVAAFTVGRVRANRFLPFIVTAAAAERDAVRHPGFIEGVTIVRPPLVIGTFSLWRNAREMRQYAVGSYPGGHSRAIKKDQEGQFNHEMFFSRYRPYAAEGQWKGRNPLAMLAPPSDGPGSARGARVGDPVGSVRHTEPNEGWSV
jgi:hypothetical protein